MDCNFGAFLQTEETSVWSQCECILKVFIVIGLKLLCLVYDHQHEGNGLFVSIINFIAGKTEKAIAYCR